MKTALLRCVKCEQRSCKTKTVVCCTYIHLTMVLDNWDKKSFLKIQLVILSLVTWMDGRCFLLCVCQDRTRHPIKERGKALLIGPIDEIRVCELWIMMALECLFDVWDVKYFFSSASFSIEWLVYYESMLLRASGYFYPLFLVGS